MTLSVSLTTSCSDPRNAVPTKKVVPLPYLPVLLSSPTPYYSFSHSLSRPLPPLPSHLHLSSPSLAFLSSSPYFPSPLFYTPLSPTLSLPLPYPSSLNPPSTHPSFPLSPPFLRWIFYLCPSDQDQPGEMAALQDQDQQRKGPDNINPKVRA